MKPAIAVLRANAAAHGAGRPAERSACRVRIVGERNTAASLSPAARAGLRTADAAAAQLALEGPGSAPRAAFVRLRSPGSSGFDEAPCSSSFDTAANDAASNGERMLKSCGAAPAVPSSLGATAGGAADEPSDLSSSSSALALRVAPTNATTTTVRSSSLPNDLTRVNGGMLDDCRNGYDYGGCDVGSGGSDKSGYDSSSHGSSGCEDCSYDDGSAGCGGGGYDSGGYGSAAGPKDNYIRRRTRSCSGLR